MKTHTVKLKIEKSTKNKEVYAEIEGDKPQVIGSLYLNRWAVMEGGKVAETITVTIVTQ